MHPVDFAFLERFPNGLQDEEWIALGNKHKNGNLVQQVKENFSKENLSKLIKEKKYDEICEISLKLLKRASVVSVFEKVAFGNYMAHEEIHKDFALGLYDIIHNFNQESFEKFALLLARYRTEKNSNVAKWTVLTFFISFYDRERFVFIKPTTTKKIANALKTDICYSSYPTYETYDKVYNMIMDFREESDLCRGQDTMLTEAVLYCVTNL